MFKEYSKYFRNALMRVNYANYSAGIVETDEYLIRFYTNLLMEEKIELRNPDLVLNSREKYGNF